MFKKLIAFGLLNQGYAFAAETGFVKIRQGHEVYVEYTKAKAGRPTLVLVNGLVYDLRYWDDYIRRLTDDGIGVVLYNFRGQSKTLLREVDQRRTPEFFTQGLSPELFAQELSQLLTELGLDGKKVSVAGLSFGGAIAADFAARYPERLAHLILMAPLVVSLDKYDPMGAWIRGNLDAMRLWWGPIWGPMAYDYYYDMIYRSYLVGERISADRIPKDMQAIPDVYKESVFHQVRAMRDFDLKTYAFKGADVHLILAGEEDVPVYADQLRAWENFDRSARGSLVYLPKAAHGIPATAPAEASQVTLRILENDGTLAHGRLYRAESNKILSCHDTKAMKDGDCH